MIGQLNHLLEFLLGVRPSVRWFFRFSSLFSQYILLFVHLFFLFGQLVRSFHCGVITDFFVARAVDRLAGPGARSKCWQWTGNIETQRVRFFGIISIRSLIQDHSEQGESKDKFVHSFDEL